MILMIIKFGERLLRISPRIIIGTTSFRGEAHFSTHFLVFGNRTKYCSLLFFVFDISFKK